MFMGWWCSSEEEHLPSRSKALCLLKMKLYHQSLVYLDLIIIVLKPQISIDIKLMYLIEHYGGKQTSLYPWHRCVANMPNSHGLKLLRLREQLCLSGRILFQAAVRPSSIWEIMHFSAVMLNLCGVPFDNNINHTDSSLSCLSDVKRMRPALSCYLQVGASVGKGDRRHGKWSQ